MTQTLHKSQVHCSALVSSSDKIAVRSRPLLCLQVANLASGLSYCWSLLRNNKHQNKFSNVHIKLR